MQAARRIRKTWVVRFQAERRSLFSEDISAMISLEDCIGLCGLDEDKVAAISEHEHIPEMAAGRIGELFADAAPWRRNHPNHDH